MFVPKTRAECPGTSFKCDDGTCVPEHAFCNSIVDCKDGSDEPEAACKREFRTREEDYCPFRCHNGRCRSASILCTQSDGCGDQSDELQCQVCRKFRILEHFLEMFIFTSFWRRLSTHQQLQPVQPTKTMKNSLCIFHLHHI